jgi:hypothetical protein
MTSIYIFTALVATLFFVLFVFKNKFDEATLCVLTAFYCEYHARRMEDKQ